jgi:predicted transcriptional regulator
MQLQLIRKLIGMYVDRIISEVFPAETGAARLQQLGLFTLIFALEDNGEAVTASRLAELTGQSLSAVYKQLEKLERINVIARKKQPAKHGRGYVYLLSIKHNEKTRRLLEALKKSAEAKARGGR